MIHMFVVLLFFVVSLCLCVVRRRVLASVGRR